MVMPKNIKFERRDEAGPDSKKRRAKELTALQEAARIERVTRIDQDELEARTLLAQREFSFQGGRSPGAEAAREILDTYNAVVADGRYVGLFLSQPKAAAELVGTEISDAAVDWLGNEGNLTAAIDFGGKIGTVTNPAVVAVAVVVVVLEVTHAPGEEFVLDPAGQLKL